MKEATKAIFLINDILTSLKIRARMIEKEPIEETRLELQQELLKDQDEFRNVLISIKNQLRGTP